VAASNHEPVIAEPARLAAWLDEHGLPGAGLPLAARFVSGGASNEIFELRRGAHRFVLRRPPPELPEGRNETMLREYRVLAALADSDVPHPRVLGACGDPAVMGGAWFYLMEYVDGWSPMQLQGGRQSRPTRSEPEASEGGPLQGGGARWPAPFDSDASARRDLAFALVGGIAKLARVDWRAAGLADFGKPDGFLARQVDRWLAHLARIQFRELPGLDSAALWLREHTPASFTPGIIHGDYQFANVMFGHGVPARLAAIVDWEMSTIGDPLLDFAWVLMTWPDPGERDASYSAGFVDYRGMPSRAELIDFYARETGLPVDQLDYYVVLARFKMACVLEAGYARYVAGGADNRKMASFGEIVLDMARRAAELAASSKL
jgi:aminoglycoside phosphotransferase (APT) family kinase protein